MNPYYPMGAPPAPTTPPAAPKLSIDETIRVIVISVLWDLMLAPFAVPLLLWLLDRVRPARLAL